MRNSCTNEVIISYALPLPTRPYATTLLRAYFAYKITAKRNSEIENEDDISSAIDFFTGHLFKALNSTIMMNLDIFEDAYSNLDKYSDERIELDFLTLDACFRNEMAYNIRRDGMRHDKLKKLSQEPFLDNQQANSEAFTPIVINDELEELTSQFNFFAIRRKETQDSATGEDIVEYIIDETSSQSSPHKQLTETPRIY